MKKAKKVSIIITAWKEPRTVRELVRDIENQIGSLNFEFEILLLCPDEDTANAGKSEDYLHILKWEKDEGRGKPAALNVAFKRAAGDFLVLTDGDVTWSENALPVLLSGMVGSRDGCVTGQPVPKNPRKEMFGFWAHLLTEMAHIQRMERSREDRFLVASGYLMLIRAGIVKELPENVLSDDALISYMVSKRGYRIGYAPNAKVIVKFPTNFSDWIKQKSRSGGGYFQLTEFINVPKDKMRSFTKEIGGIVDVLRYPKNLRELWWTFLLILARMYLWVRIFWERKITKRSFEKTWVRIESTK